MQIALHADGTRMSLPRYWDIEGDADARYGCVLGEEDFLRFFGCSPTENSPPAEQVPTAHMQPQNATA
jgi:hypothetical protein